MMDMAWAPGPQFSYLHGFDGCGGGGGFGGCGGFGGGGCGCGVGPAFNGCAGCAGCGGCGFGGSWKGGSYSQPAYRPPVSDKAYVERNLREVDGEHFVGAALVPYRKVGDSVEVLLTWEKPWNIMTNRFDDLSWTFMGGKRIKWEETTADATAIRCFHEAVGQGVAVPNDKELRGLLSDKSFVLWYPTGKFALLLVEAKDDTLSDLPAKFAEAKEGRGPQEEFILTANGVRKWTKQIEALEWVSADSLTPEPKKGCSDLLQNVLKVKGFQDFLVGATDPADAPAAADNVSPKPKKKGCGKGAWKGGGFKGFKGGYGVYPGGGKAMPMAGVSPMGMPMAGLSPIQPPPPMPVTTRPMFAPSAPGGQKQETQLQMYGEQLYLLVQPLTPNQFVAQKVTGMLLELPSDELVLNLTNREELVTRVNEALELMREDGII
eukprot:TRINITY_DN16247_c0_g1_i1.p1 TRINITY_DN16247_c0_g1~~TRINITY_DN16247_c0_g1_i1.p1  ORF type:complete len:434 (-),score=110.13 TRINITY_DN16247_c0_g1_i1:82-1383(-)